MQIHWLHDANFKFKIQQVSVLFWILNLITIYLFNRKIIIIIIFFFS